eukprot:399084-Pelagomonas_calceolata.AAC.5
MSGGPRTAVEPHEDRGKLRPIGRHKPGWVKTGRTTTNGKAWFEVREVSCYCKGWKTTTNGKAWFEVAWRLHLHGRAMTSCEAQVNMRGVIKKPKGRENTMAKSEA